MTITELLVATLVAGILAGITYPTILHHQNKARQSEALATMGSIGRGQQIYLHENGMFSGDIESLGLGIDEDTVNYAYSIALNSPTETSTTAAAEKNGIESYTEGTSVIKIEGQLFKQPSLRCKSLAKRKLRTKPKMQFRNNKPSCPKGFRNKN